MRSPSVRPAKQAHTDLDRAKLVWVKKTRTQSLISPYTDPGQPLWALIDSSVNLRKCITIPNLHVTWPARLLWGSPKILHEMASTTYEPFNKYQFPSDFLAVISTAFSPYFSKTLKYLLSCFYNTTRSIFPLWGMFDHLFRQLSFLLQWSGRPLFYPPLPFWNCKCTENNSNNVIFIFVPHKNLNNFSYLPQIHHFLKYMYIYNRVETLYLKLEAIIPRCFYVSTIDDIVLQLFKVKEIMLYSMWHSEICFFPPTLFLRFIPIGV